MPALPRARVSRESPQVNAIPMLAHCLYHQHDPEYCWSCSPEIQGYDGVIPTVATWVPDWSLGCPRCGACRDNRPPCPFPHHGVEGLGSDSSGVEGTRYL